MENQINASQANENRKVVPYDKGRKTVTFYDTFVDINGDVIKYDDIAVIQSSALNSSSMIYFSLTTKTVSSSTVSTDSI